MPSGSQFLPLKLSGLVLRMRVLVGGAWRGSVRAAGLGLAPRLFLSGPGAEGAAVAVPGKVLSG